MVVIIDWCVDMNKILLLVYVPLLEEEYDILIPINQKMGVVKKYIVNLINEINMSEVIRTDAIIYDKDTCTTYDNNIYVKDSGIKNGAKMVLI